MIGFIRKWFRRDQADEEPGSGRRATDAQPPSRTATVPPKPATSIQTEPRQTSRTMKLDPNVEGRIESSGPGKNVLIRNKYQREDTGTHDTLKILDDSLVDSGEETGIDPYNTGNFDRSRNWDKRFRN